MYVYIYFIQNSKFLYLFSLKYSTDKHDFWNNQTKTEGQPVMTIQTFHSNISWIKDYIKSEESLKTSTVVQTAYKWLTC